MRRPACDLAFGYDDVVDVERRTQELGLSLLEYARSGEPWMPSVAVWDEAVLDFCMRHPPLRAELFRFIDVLPALPAEDVTGHLVEYLGRARADLPPPLRWTFDLTSPDGRFGRIVSRAARQNVSRMARRFIAGSRATQVIDTIRALRHRRMATTLDALGEAVLSEREADAYRDTYLELIRSATPVIAALPEDPLIDRDHDGSALPRVNVSLKLSALTSVFDPIDPDGVLRAVVPRLSAILDAAKERSAFVYVDMEQSEKKDLTLRIFQEVLSREPYRDTPHVGIVLQAYLRDVDSDLRKLADWARSRGTPVWVRLVKGAYWDSETVLAKQRGWRVPVWEEKWQTDESYERSVAHLLDASPHLRPAFASHNVRSLGRALALVEERRLPPRFAEFQALYGMADGLKSALVEFGQRVRVYAPFGDLIPGMAYLVRRLLENTSNESFVRHELAQGEEALALVQPPSRASARKAEEIPMIATPSPFESFVNEPLADFSDPAARARFSEAISGVSSNLGGHCPIVISGREIDGIERIVRVAPDDGRRIVATSASATAKEADLAVEAAREGFSRWRAVPAEQRAEILEKAAGLLSDRRDELAGWVCVEAGKPWRDADADIAEAVDFCRYYAAAHRAFCAPEPSSVPGEDNVTIHVPRGPTAIISPWNFPIAILTGMTAAALVTGNPVILKPAEQTPTCAYHVFRVFREAGVPESAIHFLPGVGELVGARLVEHPDTATIAFTGSRAVGHWIARTAADTSTGVVGIKRVIAEMGGKNPIVVDDDADLDEAIPGVLASAFGYAGQKCSACSRVVVSERIHDAFVARLVQAAKALVTGVATDPATVVGPLVDRESVERLERYLALAEREGRVVYRGRLSAGTEHGFFFAPVIVTNVSPESRLSQEEIFGPLLVVLRARDFDDALRIANSTEYALTGGFYSRSPAHIERARQELDVGNLYINRKVTGAQVGRQPFGGHRHSGTGGKAGGRDYLLHFVDARTITENTLRRGFAPE